MTMLDDRQLTRASEAWRDFWEWHEFTGGDGWAHLYLHSEIVGCLLILIGVQAIGTGFAARAFGVYFITEQDELFRRLRGRLRLEHGLMVALVFVALGLALLGVVIATWAESGFGTLQEQRLAILAATVIAVGAQIFFTSFLISILGLRRRRED